MTYAMFIVNQYNIWQIKPSTIEDAGDGLFCFYPKSGKKPVFKKGQKICDYKGEIIDNKVLYERYHDGNSDYTNTTI